MQRRKLKHGHAVLLEWSDSTSFEGWSYDPKARRSPIKLRSLGYVVQSSPEALVLTTSIGQQGQSIDDLSVPWGAITRLEILPGDYSLGGPSPDNLHG